MRTSEYYGVQVPELGDRADITVVSQAIIDSEDNQSGKVENMKASLSGSTIALVSESRTDKLTKYYNGLAVQFISPVNAQAGTGYKIKVDNLGEQPYNNKVDIKVGDIIQATYGSTGFVSANTPIPRSSAVDSTSEVTVATSKAVKQAYDKGKEGLDKANTKLDAGSVSVDYNSGKKLEDKIKGLDSTKQNKTDSGLQTDSKEIVGAINELNTDLNGMTFYNKLTQLGFENDLEIINTITLKDIVTKMKDNSVFIFNSSSQYQLIDMPRIYGLWYIIRNTNVRATAILYPSGTSGGRMYVVPLRPSEATYEEITMLSNIDPLFLGNAGISKVIYIQDAGTKIKGNGYIDKDTGRLYKCKETNDDIFVSGNFEPADNISNSKLNDEVEILANSTTAQGSTYNYSIPSGYKFINIYMGFIDTSTLYGRIDISRLTTNPSSASFDRYSVNDFIALNFTKTQVSIPERRTETNDTFKYLRLTVSKV